MLCHYCLFLYITFTYNIHIQHIDTYNDAGLFSGFGRTQNSSMRLPNGARWGMPLRRLAGDLNPDMVGGGVDGVKLCVVILLLSLPVVVYDSSESEEFMNLFFLFFLSMWPLELLPPILQPSEQNRNESSRLRVQTSHVLVTPFPGLGCGRSFKKTTRALFIMYVCTPVMSNTFCISFTRITSWYDDLLI